MSTENIQDLIVIDDDDNALVPFLKLENTKLFKFGNKSKYTNVINIEDWLEILKLLQ